MTAVTDEPPRPTGPVFSLPLLGWLLVAALGWTCLYLPLFGANLDPAEVTEIVPASSAAVVYKVVVGGCVGSLPGAPGSHSVGDQVLVRHLGCSDIREASGTVWWLPYPIVLVLLAFAAALVVVAWARPDLLRRVVRRLWPVRERRRWG